MATHCCIARPRKAQYQQRQDKMTTVTTVTTVTSGVGGGQGQMELWKASLCGCMDDCTSCCLTFWCPCFQYGFNKQATTGEGCCVPCCVYFLVVSLAWPVMPCIAASNRTTIRQVYNLPAQVRKGSQINRFFFAAMCPSLSLSLSLSVTPGRFRY